MYFYKENKENIMYIKYLKYKYAFKLFIQYITD